MGSRVAYEVRQMNMTIGVQEHVVWLDVTMYNALAMYVSQGAAQFGNPKSHCFFCKRLSRDVET